MGLRLFLVVGFLCVTGCTPLVQCVRYRQEAYQEVRHPGYLYFGSMKVPAGNVEIVPRTRMVCDEWRWTKKS